MKYWQVEGRMMVWGNGHFRTIRWEAICHRKWSREEGGFQWCSHILRSLKNTHFRKSPVHEPVVSKYGFYIGGCIHTYLRIWMIAILHDVEDSYHFFICRWYYWKNKGTSVMFLSIWIVKRPQNLCNFWVIKHELVLYMKY